MIRAGKPLSLLFATAIIATACGGGDDAAPPAPTPTTAAPVAAAAGAADAQISTAEYLGFRSQETACGAEAPAPAQEITFDSPGDAGVTGPVTAVLHTSCGDITLELDPELAPQTVNSFVFLAENGYFDGSVSHRVVPGFVIQAGDPTATGRGDPGYAIPDELPPEGFLYTRGTVAMANAGPNTGGSQFFLVLADVSLSNDFAVFGSVTSGLEVMDRIAQVDLVARTPGGEPSSPLQTVYLNSVEIER